MAIAAAACDGNDGKVALCVHATAGMMNNRLPLFTVVIAPSISAMRVRKDMSLSSSGRRGRFRYPSAFR
ncbi:hypothetical protein ECP030477711_2734 [Escherichia coli P0304777.11]|nr:hypothetical protein ECP030477711_2734 [Escherichia coli P0304777.11]